MALIKQGRLVEDPWVAVDDIADLQGADLQGADFQGNDPLLVPFDLWRENRAALAGRDGPIGIRLAPGQSPEAIADEVERFDLIALPFAKFTDGRAYSHARLLRERYGYTGELRAVGEVLRDQFLFMHRCGFDAFEVADDRTADGWLAALTEISGAYQPTADRRTPAPILRHAERPEAPAAGPAEPAVRAAHWAY